MSLTLEQLEAREKELEERKKELEEHAILIRCMISALTQDSVTDKAPLLKVVADITNHIADLYGTSENHAQQLKACANVISKEAERFEAMTKEETKEEERHPAIIKVVQMPYGPEVDVNIVYDQWEFCGGDGFYGYVSQQDGSQWRSRPVPFRYMSVPNHGSKTDIYWKQTGFERNLDGIDDPEEQSKLLNLLNSTLPADYPMAKFILNINGKILTNSIKV